MKKETNGPRLSGKETNGPIRHNVHRNAKEKDKSTRKGRFCRRFLPRHLLRYRGHFCEERDKCADSAGSADASVPRLVADALKNITTALGFAF